MKFLVPLLLLLMASPAWSAKVQAQECLMTKDRKYALHSFEWMKRPIADSIRFCTPSDLRHLSLMTYNLRVAYKDDPRIQELDKMLRLRIEDTSGLVNVETQYRDLKTKSQIQMNGRGIIFSIFPNPRPKNFNLTDLPYYVLTAAHVADGAKTQIRVGSQVFPTRVVAIDRTSDLAILSFSQNDFLIPFAFFMPTGQLVTTLRMDLSGNGLVDGMFLNHYQLLPIEGFDEIVTPLSGILLRAKEKLPDVKYFRERLSREKTGGVLQFQVPLRQGFSGAPVLISYAATKASFVGDSIAYGYTIGGVVSLSGEGSAGTQTYDPAALENLLKKTFVEKAVSDSDWKWIVHGGQFVLVNSSERVIRLFSGWGPVGNGVVVEGEESAPSEYPELELTEEQEKLLEAEVERRVDELMNAYEKGQSINRIKSEFKSDTHWKTEIIRPRLFLENKSGKNYLLRTRPIFRLRLLPVVVA